MNIYLTDIIASLKDEIISVFGEPKNNYVCYLKDPKNVDEYTLDWISAMRKEKQQIAENSKARAIITGSGILYSDILKQQGKVIIQVDNPKRAIAKVANMFFVAKEKPGIDPTAVIHQDAVIGNNVFIGPYVVIGKCIIGDNVTIHSNTTLYDNVTLKRNVIINAGAVIGTDGLGCEREENGQLIKFPHFGNVLIEENVEIGANCQIAKGALSDTFIGKGTKINVGCYIAHNVVLGKNVWISAHAKIAGSVKVNDNATIFIGVMIKEHLLIGHDAIIGMGAVVTKNVPSGEIWIGNPAKKMIPKY